MKMEKESILALLQQVQAGEIEPQQALLQLQMQPFTDLGFAKPDMHRALRQGAAEVIFGAGKTAEQISGICREMLEQGTERLMITRLDAEKAAAVQQQIAIEYDACSALGIIGGNRKVECKGKIAVLSAGTSDMPVAEEAARTAEFLGNAVERIYDVGVSGLHRLLAQLERISSAQVIIAVAGMEGALASVVAGLVSVPVLAVPTSVGYGSGAGGIAALLSMLNSCSSGIAVLNIDNGFGAGSLASRINHLAG